MNSSRTLPLVGELASFESLGRALVAEMQPGCGLAAPQFFVDLNAKAKALDAEATARLAALALPEVSEAQVEAAARAYMSGDTVAVDWTPKQWDLRRLRDALESYRASLLGEVKP